MNEHARRVLFVQGGGEGTHDEWDHKLVDSLMRELGAAFEEEVGASVGPVLR